MKTALIGYGAWGRHHAGAIVETPGLELAGVCALSAESRAAARDRHGAPVTADYRELLAAPGLEAVDIVLPTDLHHEVTLAAVNAGLHVLLEKPMALTPEECGELVDAARRAGRVLYVAHEFRLSTQWGRMREMIAEGAIGRPLYATIDLWRRPYRLGSARWRHTRERVGSWVLEEPIHFFDLACWWMRECGAPSSVYGQGTRLPQTAEGLWDNLTAVLSFPDGAHATVTQSLAACEHHLAAKVVGERGALIAAWDGEMDRTEHPAASLRWFDGERLREVPIALSGEFFELRAQMARFAAVCRGEAELPITPEEAALAVRICYAAEESIRRQAPVAV
jgi:myo-inositol 2-dehydrogenase/D-chiro-inositol 1-dehydrogenase